MECGNVQAALRFGAAQEVNFGRGCRVIQTEKSGADLILVFDGKGNGFTPENFAGKLLGKTAGGKLLFGWSRLPGVMYVEPILSTRPPVVIATDTGAELRLEISNFGQVASDETAVLEVIVNGAKISTSNLPPLEPFEIKTVTVAGDFSCQVGAEYAVTTKLTVNGTMQEEFNSKVSAGCDCLAKEK